MIKYILFAALVYIAYLFFFRTKKEVDLDDKNSQTMVECSKCSLFISSDEALIKDGKYYCSLKCLKDD